MTLSTSTVPYTGPYSIDGNGKHKGPTALALKRAMSRMGELPWEPDKWDDAYNRKLEDALDRWNPGANGYGEGRYDKLRAAKVPKGATHAGEYALDSVCIDLIADEHAAATPPAGGTDAFRKALVDFCSKGLANGAKWTYTQGRAVDPTVDPAGYVKSDCSGSVIQAYKYACQQTGRKVPCPAKYDYSGYGNTWDDEDGHPKVTNGSYLVGDLAHYDGHVCLCIKAGNADTADWWSFGSEPPSKRKLYYRDDFKFVVRPPLSSSPDTYQTTFERLSFALRFWKVQRLVLFWRNGRRRGDPATDSSTPIRRSNA